MALSGSRDGRRWQVNRMWPERRLSHPSAIRRGGRRKNGTRRFLRYPTFRLRRVEGWGTEANAWGWKSKIGRGKRLAAKER